MIDVTTLLGALGEQTRATHPFVSRCALACSMTATVAMFAVARALVPGQTFELAGVAVLA